MGKGKGKGMGTRETSQWEAGSTCRAGKLKNKRVAAHRGIHSSSQ